MTLEVRALPVDDFTPIATVFAGLVAIARPDLVGAVSDVTASDGDFVDLGLSFFLKTDVDANGGKIEGLAPVAVMNAVFDRATLHYKGRDLLDEVARLVDLLMANLSAIPFPLPAAVT